MHLELELEDELGVLLRELNESVRDAAKELIVMELYRRGAISGGKASELLGIARLDFIQRASRSGIPYFNVSPDDFAKELDEVDKFG